MLNMQALAIAGNLLVLEDRCLGLVVARIDSIPGQLRFHLSKNASAQVLVSAAALATLSLSRP